MPGNRDETQVGVAPGVTLRALKWVAGSGPPFLLVHGLASNCRTWEAVGDRLASLGHPVAAVDLRGHGLSDKPGDGYDFATLCSDLIACLDHLEWPSAVVTGQSLGGNLVVDLAGRAPERLAGVAGIDGGAIELVRRWPSWDECWAILAPPRLAGTPAARMEAMLRHSHPDWSDWGIEATMANFEQPPDGTIRPWLERERHLKLLRALWEHRPSVALAQLRVPTLLVLASDGSQPGPTDEKRAWVEPILEAAADVEVHWLAPADHDVHVQKPVEVADLLHDASERWSAT